jgi:eukaryotic-like serine/threonine-protein kinase
VNPLSADHDEQQVKAKEIADQLVQTPGTKRLHSAVVRCGNDKDLLMEVLHHLGEQSTVCLTEVATPVRDPMANQKIGSYKIHWRLGSGGNGDVYLATRTKEPHQQVAIKILRLPDGENEEFRRRFLRERQIIALLNHPYIVKLFDADRTKDGSPYFVMEYVAGEDLDKHANSRRLTILQRLALFLKICDAVQYLHSHLIVHRDLKPANVLVDADGNPKVLDFGIAKLLRPEMMDGELITMTKRHPLTAQYASPEQWEGGLITSASDVYSLGVILFQLLTGDLPIPWSGKGYAEYQRLVCEGNLPLASKSVVKGHALLSREPSGAALATHLAGDLDAILFKAMDKEVTERYPTVAALTDDIQRHLQFLPVRARGKGLSYRTRRFLRRNRALAASIAAIVIALGLGLGMALMQRNNARHQKVVAEQQKSMAEAETRRANELAHQSDEVAQRLQHALDAKGIQDKQLRLAVAHEVNQLREIIRNDEKPNLIRGEGVLAGPARNVLLGRNYAVLAQLLTLSGDRQGAHSAFQSCVANLQRAQDAGDISRGTADTMRRCQAGL